MKLYEEIEKIFPTLKNLFEPEELLEFKNMRIADLCIYHFKLDVWIRNNLLYSNESILRPLFLENGITLGDDMSSTIIKLFHYHVSTNEQGFSQKEAADLPLECNYKKGAPNKTKFK